MPPSTISVIIPALHDVSMLERILSQLVETPSRPEIIVADGGSLDDTQSRLSARYPEVRLVQSESGRAVQMNAGAEAAKGEILLFIHADTQLPAHWHDAIEQVLSRTPNALGTFDLQFDEDGWFFRALEVGVLIRNRCLRLPYGDQGFFVRKEHFHRLQGFRPLPLMEDVDLVQRARHLGPVRSAGRPVTTSARRWREDGGIRRSWTNLKTIIRYKRGVDPAELTKAYRGRSTAVAVFCKRPVPGQVKTRLAASVGRTRAAELYQTMIESTFRNLRKMETSRITVCFSPAKAYSFFLDWLGPDYAFLPQHGDTLGERMLHALQEQSRMGATHIAIIGTDCPDLTANHLTEAFDLLDRADVVLGPCEDGGYYLLAVREPHPGLFEAIEWSTDRVLGQTLDAARRLGLNTELLATLRDIDTIQDLNASSIQVRG